MKKKNLFSIVILLLITISFNSCKKDDSKGPNPTTPTPIAPRIFDNVIFDKGSKAFFATDGSMSAPVDSNQAKANPTVIDITFIYNHDYSEPGFIDPVVRSQNTWYWQEYYTTGLSTSIETRFYKTNLTKTEFNAAKGDQSKIDNYFADSTCVIAPHAVFPTGSCIGGRPTSNPDSYLLTKGAVFGFVNTTSGKKGLLYIREDQAQGWPYAILTFDTKVDIIKQK